MTPWEYLILPQGELVMSWQLLKESATQSDSIKEVSASPSACQTLKLNNKVDFVLCLLYPP